MRGRGGNAEHRQPNHFLLTFAYGRDSRAQPPTHDWRKIKTIEEAEAIAKAAREAKDMSAVAFGHRSWRVRRNRNRHHKVVPKPVPQSGPETVQSPGPQSGPAGRVTKWSHYLYLGAGAGDEAATYFPFAWVLSESNYLNGGNWRVVGEFTEVESGRRSDRPELDSRWQGIHATAGA